MSNLCNNCGHDEYYTNLGTYSNPATRLCSTCDTEVFPFGKPPVTNNPDDCVYIDVDFTLISPMDVGYGFRDSVNHKLVAKIKEWHAAGRTIIIWTSNTGGTQHCKDAAMLCEIENYVHYYLPKPKMIVDDNHLEYYRTMNPDTLEIKESGN